MIINDVNSLMRWKTSPLPAGYYRLNWVQKINPTTNVYVNTGIIPTWTTRVIIKGTNSSDVTTAGMLFGSRNGTNFGRYWAVTWNGYYDVGFGANHNTQITPATANTDFEIDFNSDSNHTMTVNGISSTVVENTSYPEYPMFIFGLNQAGSLNNQKANNFKLKEFEVFSNYTTPILHYVPIMKDDMSEMYLYDLVNKEFEPLSLTYYTYG